MDALGIPETLPFRTDTWSWWQSRRLEYNLTLAVGGWIAYALAVGLNYVFRHPVWLNWRGGLSMTLFLGAIYLLVIGVANLCFLLGPTVERWISPQPADTYRRNAYTMGRWGSLLIPFSFPLMQLALLIGHPTPM